jgi:hypothetical protein
MANGEDSGSFEECLGLDLSLLELGLEIDLEIDLELPLGWCTSGMWRASFRHQDLVLWRVHLLGSRLEK